MTDRKPFYTDKDFQVDISSASNINSPFFLIAPHQKTQRPNPADATISLSNNSFNNAIVDHSTVKQYYSENDGVSYPKNPIVINFEESSYLDLFTDPKLFYIEYVGEQLLSPKLVYDKMKDY